MNLRPSGYEPDELPGCSTPRQHVSGRAFRSRGLRCGATAQRADARAGACGPTDKVNGFVLVILVPCALASKPGGDLLFHRLSDSTIGAVRFHGRVRDGIGWVTDAMTTKLWGQRLFGQSGTLTELKGLGSLENRCVHLISKLTTVWACAQICR